MFCKYCGQPLIGTKCSACGKETVLFQYSTELDRLMSSEQDIIADKAYQRGMDEGYQKGLSEGYQHGFAKGQADQTKAPTQTVNKKIYAVLCAVAFILGAVASWLISGSLNYRSGYSQGKTEGESAAREAAQIYYEQQLDDKYQQGWKDGEAQGKAEMEAQYAQPSATKTPPPPAPSTPPPTPVLEQNDIICSRYTNSGSALNPSPDVMNVQYILISHGYLNDTMDGIFGQNTENAVKAFQKANHLPETGEVDKVTYIILVSQLTAAKGSSPEPDELDAITTDQPALLTATPYGELMTNHALATETPGAPQPSAAPSD